MAFPSFLIDGDEFALGQTVDPLTLELSPLRISQKLATYEMKRKQRFVNPGLFKYSVDLIKPATGVEDLSRIFKVPKSYIFQLYNYGKFKFLFDHLNGKPCVLVSFHLCDKIDTILPNTVMKKSSITRIEYGYQFFAVLQSFNGETDENFKNVKHVENALNALFQENLVNDVPGSCTLIFSDRSFDIRPFDNLFNIINDVCMSKSTPIKIYLNIEFDLNDDQNFDQLLIDILYCNQCGKELRRRVQPGYIQEVLRINVNDIVELQHALSASYLYPLMELNMAYEFSEFVQTFCKSYSENVFEMVAATKRLLICALEVTERFVSLHNYWFILCGEKMFANVAPGTRFFITNGRNDSTYYDVFHKDGWIFGTFYSPNAPEDDLFFIPDEINRCKNYGIAYSNSGETLFPAASSRRFVHSCPCGIPQTSNYWICPECRSFFYYHQKRPQYVSCKCGSIEMSSLHFVSFQKLCVNHGPLKYVPSSSDSQKPDKNYYNILIMGPSGAGKSTLVNGIANYLQYETLQQAEADDNVTSVIPCQFEVQDDEYKSHVVSIGKADDDEENFNSLGHSVTQRPKNYYFRINSGEIVHIIDTPGLADSRGVEQDSKNLELIRQAIINVGELHALCFVLKPNESKLTVGLESTMRQLLSIFPKKALESVIFCFTNSRGTFYKPGDSVGPIKKLIDDIQKECGASLKFGKSNVFCMDNEGFRFLCARACKIDYTSATYKEYEDSWKQSRQATIALIDRIKNEKSFDTRIINFYTELACVMKKWSEWLKLPNCKITYERCQRFGTVAHELEKNLIGSDASDFVQLAEKMRFKTARFVSDLKGIMNILHEEFVESDLDDKIAVEIRTFLDRYTYQF